MSGKRLPTFHIVIPGSPDELDKKLRLLAGDIAHKMELFKPLIAEAKSKEIHKDLGFKSWPAYIADVIGKCMRQLPADDRAQIVAMLAGEGMSNRVIADAVGVNEITVRRDKDEVRHDVAPEPLPSEEQAAIHEHLRSDREKLTAIIGRDGKTYPPKPQPKPAQKLTPAMKRRKMLMQIGGGKFVDSVRAAKSVLRAGLDDSISPMYARSLAEALNSQLQPILKVYEMLLERASQ